MTIIDIAKKKKKEPDSVDGKTYMLDISKQRAFQCGGFSVNTKNFINTATKSTQVEPILRAVKDGILIDISNQDLIKSGLKAGHTSASAVKTQDTGNMAFVKRMPDGSRLLVVPKDEADRDRIAKEIAETGDFTIQVNEQDDANISGIQTEDVKTECNTPKRRKVIIK